MKELKGIGIGTEKTKGKIKFFNKNNRKISHTDGYISKEEELEKLYKAINGAREKIEKLRKKALDEIGKEEAQIFEIHGMLLDDEDFLNSIKNNINDGTCVDKSIELAAKNFCEMLIATNDPYLSARVADIKDISNQILDELSSQNNEEKIDTSPYVLVAQDLSPSETVRLDKSMILGFVTFEGSSNSHTAILARAMGIPSLVNVGNIDAAFNNCECILDAEKGLLLLEPTAEISEKYDLIIKKQNRIKCEHEEYSRKLISQPAISKNGHRVMIYANVGNELEVEKAFNYGAEGIGLLRSEFLYLSYDRYPTEEELFLSYKSIVQKSNNKRVVIRTLDIGADKQIKYFDIPKEENPALGYRGVRICLDREEVFKCQLRAILRASAFGKVAIMIPMIASLEEVKRCKELLEICKGELFDENLEFDSKIEFGIMIETPAAAIISDELAEEVNFFSVGTNDLTQYTLAADRQNPRVEKISKNIEPILKLISYCSQQIHKNNGWIGICGELAADLGLTQKFIEMHIDELSVSPPYLLGVRRKVIECD